MSKYLSTFLIILSITPAILGQCNRERATQFLRRSVYDFSVDLVTRINVETESHFVVSTLSPWILISMLSLGASDPTLAEIKQVLKLHPHKCFNNKYFDITRAITTSNGNTILERSSNIFVDERLFISNIFVERVLKTGLSSVQVMPFDNFVSTAADINDYVSRATHETIDEIINANDLEGAYLLMIDALYFKGFWKIPFSHENTEVSAFYDETGMQIGDVNLMFTSGLFNQTSIDLIHAEVLELPYESGSRYSMLIFVPYKNVSVSNVMESLSKINIASIFSAFKSDYALQKVDVQIPRFKISSDINNLKELLIDMGLRTMFDSVEARFPDISDYQLHVSNFIQKAYIEVTEEGTTAAAVSAAELESRMSPLQFLANKPFLFTIVDRIHEVALFTGAYSKPSVYN